MTKKIAVVSGANRGLGLGTCVALAKEGIHVIALGRDENKLLAAIAPHKTKGLPIEPFVVDITDDDAVKRLASFIAKTHDRVDILVNNAGVFNTSGSQEKSSESCVLSASPAAVMKVINTNTLGPMRLTQALLPFLRKAPAARIVNISSGMGGLTEMDGGSPGYRLSKTALNALTRIFAAELKETKIKVNSVCPGWVRTDMGGATATRSIDEGIRGIVWAATLPDDGPSAGFFRDGEPIPW